MGWPVRRSTSSTTRTIRSTCARAAAARMRRCSPSWRERSRAGLSGRSAIRRAWPAGPRDRGSRDASCLPQIALGKPPENPCTSGSTQSAGFRPYGGELSPFPSQCPHPHDLRQWPPEAPVVLLREHLVRFSAEQRARIRAHPGEPRVPEPGAHLADRVPVLLDVLVLIANPRRAPPWLALPFAKHRVAGNPAITAQARAQPPRAHLHPRHRIVDADDDDVARAHQP